jgi:hypothetical protein
LIAIKGSGVRRARQRAGPFFFLFSAAADVAAASLNLSNSSADASSNDDSNGDANNSADANIRRKAPNAGCGRYIG